MPEQVLHHIVPVDSIVKLRVIKRHVLNLGNHRSENLMDMIGVLADCLQVEPEFEMLPMQPGDVPATYADTERAKQKLGFEPIDPDVARLLRKEEAKMRRDRRHRSSAAVLRELTMENLVLHLAGPRDDLIGVFPWTNVGHAATRVLATYGGPGARSRKRIERDAATMLGIGDTAGWSKGDREGFSTWAPVVLAMPEVRRWSPTTKASLVDVFRKKGARHEVDFIRAATGHAPFHRALKRLCLAWEEQNV